MAPHTTPAKAFLNANWLLKDSLEHNEYHAAKQWADECVKALDKLQTELVGQDYIMHW